MGDVTTRVLGFTRVSVVRKGTSRQQTKGTIRSVWVWGRDERLAGEKAVS